MCVETTPQEKITKEDKWEGAEERASSSVRSWKGAGKAPGCPATYCRVGVGAEYGVLPDDAVQLERGQPGHEDHGG